MQKVLNSDGPILQVYDTHRNEKRLIIGFRRRSTRLFFSALSDVFHYYGLTTVRKHVDHFSNDVTIMSFYLVPVAKDGDIAGVMSNIVEEASLI